MRSINLVLAIALSVMICSCNQQKTQKNKAVQKSETVKYVTVEDLLQQADSLSDKTINVMGIIDHVCRHGGKRFKIISTDGSQELKIEFGENFDVLDANVVGSIAKVTGKLIPVEMNAQMVKAWEDKVKENHAGEENTEHYKQEIAEIQEIYRQIVSSEILFFTAYSIIADCYELEQ